MEQIRLGETYDHADYGPVEVTGIWRGVSEVDSAHNTSEEGTIIVRYVRENEGRGGVGELVDPVDEFFKAVEEGK